MIQTRIPSNMESTPRPILAIEHHHDNWSNLPTDLLELISMKLSFSNFLSLKGVCSSWRVCSSLDGASKRIRIPLLVFFSEYQSIESKIDKHVLFLGINKGRPYEHKETPLSLKQGDVYHEYHKVVGSHPDGWLILKDNRELHYFLLELLTQVRIDLPKLMKHDDTYSWSENVILSDNPNCRQDFIVIMLYRHGHEQKLVFWRNGDSRWSRLQQLYDRGELHSDIIWCNDCLYAEKLLGGRSVEVWDFNRNGTSLDFCKIKTRISRLNLVRMYRYLFISNQLVASSTDELLLVSHTLSNKKWKVFKVDLGEERCARLRTLNGQVLVMVDNNLFCLSSMDVEKNGYKANSIYFANMKRSKNDTFGMRIKLSNYSLEEKKVETLWRASIPFGVDVKLQPVGLLSLNIKSCSSALQQMV